MGKRIFIAILLTLSVLNIHSQAISQTVKGRVTDRETGAPLVGANITVANSIPPSGTTTATDGRFRLELPVGRFSFRISYLGYDDLLLNNILISTGKEVIIDISLQEKIISTSDVIIRSDNNGRKSINQMAIISTNTVRTNDALRYAGGFYDPSRIVNAFAGVIAANSDQSNDIVIRGNSSRGLLWRLEGIEIPNPNHFSDGQGGSGGAFSAITSNVIDNFDFFTGAFPAEFGNAFSGVMDLNLRKGNPDKHEYAFQTGMIGAEISAEGAFSSKSNASFLVNARYTNFQLLADLGIIDLGETNYAPRTKDLAININLPTSLSGTFNLFGIYGSSRIGITAIHDTAVWINASDQYEEMEKQSSFIVGLKHLYTLPGKKTYIKTILAYTSFFDSYSEGYLDSSYVRSDDYQYSYLYPALRSSFLANHKFNPRHTVRTGINFNYLTATMSNTDKNSSGGYDTLVSPDASGSLLQGHAQWKFRPVSDFEINSGLHLLKYSSTHQLSIEPRFGFRWNVTPENAFIAGFGIHSRAESMAVYNAMIKNTSGDRSARNSNLGLSKAVHWVAGVDLALNKDIRLRLEGYIQYLYNIPIGNRPTSEYSTLNSSERLPDLPLENEGTGSNNGLELTIEKAFTKNYYYLITGSIFNSWYKAGDQHKYNTYYNTRFVTNFLAGKDFYVGKNRRNSIGINAKYLFRGGYRYTPVDITKSLKAKRIINKTHASYENQLPDFIRLDAGINFRKNHPGYSWIIMLDIQNLTNRKNVFRRRFTYDKGLIVANEVLSLGMVPVLNFRVEF